MKEELAGTTAVCVIIKDKKLFCVRIILVKNIKYILYIEFFV